MVSMFLRPERFIKMFSNFLQSMSVDCNNLTFVKLIKTPLTKLLFGLPDEHRLRESFIKNMNTYESLAQFFRATRHGFRQYVHSNEFKILEDSFDYVQFMVRSCVPIHFTRSLLLFTDSDSILFYLGDPAYGYENAWTIHVLLSLHYINIWILKELILWTESKGNFVGYVIFDHIRRSDFNESQLEFMIDHYRITFYRISYSLLGLFIRIVIVSPFTVLTCILSLCLSHPLIRTDPFFALISLFWLIPFALSTAFTLTSVFCAAGFLLLDITLYSLRFRSVVQYAKLLSTKKIDFTLNNLSNLIQSTTRLMNTWEREKFILRHILLFVYTVGTLSADYAIFLGIVLTNYSPIFAQFILILGMFTLTLIAVFTFFCGDFILQLAILYHHLQMICSRFQFSLQYQLRVFEIMERIMGPFNGIKAGDFVTLTRKFTVKFLLETVAIFCLLMIHIRPKM